MIKCDILVIGGGTAGCACAYIGAKYGLNVVLLEKSITLGGTMTSSLVIPVMKSVTSSINTEFYDDLIAEMKNLGGQFTYQNNPGWFNPELLKIALDKMLSSVGVKIIFNSEVINTKINSNLVCHAEIYNELLSEYIEEKYADNIITQKANILSEYIEAKYFVDATGNGNFCKKINCEFLDSEENFQPSSLRFIMDGVDVSKFAKFLLDTDSNREVTTVEYTSEQTHLSTAYTWDSNKHWALAPFFDRAVTNNELKDEDRNYFQLFTIPAMPAAIAFNCPRLLKNLNKTTYFEYSSAIIEARQAIYRLSNFCKKYLPGFENAYISNIADALGVRISNRVRGRYVYTKEDLVQGRKFKNPVLEANYPIDVHSDKKNSSILENVRSYQLPIESLMSNDYDNVFMVGRNLSADFEAQAALRVQASCFSMGEGVAKWILKSEGR